jgi:hypothetical protein
MCNNTDALKQLIDTGLVLDGESGLALTGWNEAEGYDRNGSLTNKITTQYGIVRGAIEIQQGAGRNTYGFGGFGLGKRDSHDRQEELTVDRLRGILVTALAVSHTEEGRKLAGAFGAIVETLASNCFQPLSFDLGIEAAEDPHITVSMTNGMVTVRLDSKPIDETNQKLKLELPVKYILGRNFANVLLGESDRGYSNTGLTVLLDGKWERFTGINARTFDENESINVDRLDVDQVVSFVSEKRRELTGAVLKEVLRQLSTLGSDVHIYSVTASHSEYRSTPSVQVYLANSVTRKHYSLDFAV